MSAIAVIIPPLFGLLGTITSMVRAFGEIKQGGEVEHKDLAGDVSVALQATMWGLMISFVAMIIFAVALTFFLKRRQSLRAFEKENLSDKTLK